MTDWTYEQGTGLLKDPFGQPFVHGYSGTGLGRNNPAMESVKGVGPIPKGRYAISKAYNHMTLGPCVMNLDACPGTDTHGRGDFRIHGNNAEDDASHGCVIAGKPYRQTIALSLTRFLTVVE
jgi:hypothetical protein